MVADAAPIEPAESELRLQMRGIRKSFGGVEVLHGVDFDVRAGEVHALVGENGAGKSTLMKILAGDYQSDAGTVALNGEQQVFRTPHAAHSAGITMIHQELSYIPQLTVAENFYLGRLPSAAGAVRWGDIYEGAQKALEDFGAPIDAHALMSTLPLGQRQIVEIVRAVHQHAQLIVMDEPTASLNSQEVAHLFTTIRQLKRLGVSIIYISHHLDEVFVIADRVTVLRDGRRVFTAATAECTKEELIHHMVGRDVHSLYQRAESVTGDALLDVRNLSVGHRVHDVSLTVHRGEVLGVYGLIGAGQEELARALFGLIAPTSGRILVEGREQRHLTPARAIESGIGFIPADRKSEGLVLQLPVRENLTLPILQRISWNGLLKRRGEERLAGRLMQEVGVRSKGSDQLVAYLSGGNQQKIVVGKWLEAHLEVLLLNEPTRGVDVGAKAEIYHLIQQLTERGIGVLLVSSDLPEVLSLSDRIAVMVRGRVTTVLDARRTTQQEILQYATTGKANEYTG